MRLPDPRRLPYALLRRFPPPPGLFWQLARLANDSFLAGVSGIVLNDVGETLFFRHTYRTTPWGLPGGWMRRGESPGEAFEREVAEESGLLVRAEQLLLIGTAPDRPKLDFVVGARLDGGVFRPSREVSAHRWAAPGSLDLSGYDRTVLAEVARRRPGEVGRFAYAWSPPRRPTS